MSKYEIMTAIEAGEWRVVSTAPHGQIFEKTDGSAIITGTWDGAGMKYEVVFATKKDQRIENIAIIMQGLLANPHIGYGFENHGYHWAAKQAVECYDLLFQELTNPQPLKSKK